jgi:hypothetical protein
VKGKRRKLKAGNHQKRNSKAVTCMNYFLYFIDSDWLSVISDQAKA